eukprot:symbB.v1.2.037863.t1/scaffold5713.1/size24319/3
MLKRKLLADVRSFGDVIRASAKGDQWALALLLLAEMEKEACLPDLITFSSAICETTPWPHTLQVLQQMEEVAVQPSAVTFSSITAAMLAVQEWQMACQLFFCQRAGFGKPDMVAYSGAISASAMGARWEDALALCADMTSKRLSADVICYNAIIQACGGQWKKALQALEDLQQQMLQPTQISFNTAISACGRCGQWQPALALLDIIPKRQIAVDVLALNGVLSAFEKTGLWRMGLDLVETMAKQNLVPDVITCNSIISACGRSHLAHQLRSEARSET